MIDVSNCKLLSTATTLDLVPVNAECSVSVCTDSTLSPTTWADITWLAKLVDLIPNLSTAFIKYFPVPTNGVVTLVAGLPILGTNTVVFA